MSRDLMEKLLQKSEWRWKCVMDIRERGCEGGGDWREPSVILQEVLITYFLIISTFKKTLF
jgi:hypothetical protein